jgi:LysR family hydrogen peroxide-inducible transcriptional activator
MIDRYQLRYFLAVVDSGGFGRAADRVGVAQPTLSVGIRKLEETLGQRLFLRSNRRVSLTEAGVRLLDRARRIEHEYNLAESDVAGLVDQRRIRLGILSTIPAPLIERIIIAHRAAPRPDAIEIVDDDERGLAARLERGRIDLALGIVRDEGEVLHEEGYALALPLGHRFADAPSVPGEALGGEVVIVRRQCEVLADTSRYFTDRGVRPPIGLRTTNDEKALALVRAGLGITVMPDGYRDPAVARPRLEGFGLKRRIGLLYARHAADLATRDGGLVAAIREGVRRWE